MPVATGPATSALNYLEKLIQVPFRLPSLGYPETRIYVTLLLVLNACGEDSDEFQKLPGLARELLCRPWTGPGLYRKIGRGSCRERGCMYVLIPVSAVAVQKT